MSDNQKHPLAEQALEIFNLQGQDEATRFTVQNLSDGPHQPAHSQGTHVYVLSDQSIVQFNPGTATFAWQDHHDPPNGTSIEARTMSLKDNKLPGPDPQRVHMCDWPNEQDLYQSFLEMVQTEAHRRLGQELHDYANMPEHLLHLQAPDLHTLAKDVLSSFEPSDILVQTLDAELQHCADTLADQLPKDQFEALVTQVMSALGE